MTDFDKNIISITQSPSMDEIPQAHFKKENFDALVWDKGQPVYLEKALRCPCKEEQTDNLSSCRNCGGSGYIFINKKMTKMALQAMNYDTVFKSWSEENRGMVKITTLDVDVLCFMDRITQLRAISIHNQTLYPKLINISGNQVLFAYTSYPIIDIIDIFLFDVPGNPLKLLQIGQDYIIDGDKGKIILDESYQSLDNPKLSVRYNYHPQYHVTDLVRNIMYVDSYDEGNLVNKRMPIHAVGRLAHYNLKPLNFDGEYLFDNSYIQASALPDFAEIGSVIPLPQPIIINDIIIGERYEIINSKGFTILGSSHKKGKFVEVGVYSVIDGTDKKIGCSISVEQNTGDVTWSTSGTIINGYITIEKANLTW